MECDYVERKMKRKDFANSPDSEVDDADSIHARLLEHAGEGKK